MRLNHDEFTVLLARALDSDEKEASGTLKAWVDAILRETEENGSCDVTGLGTFRKGEDGSMILDPEKSLSMEVNHKYAGMSPIEVSPPKSAQPEAGEDAAADADPGISDAQKPGLEEDKITEETTSEETEQDIAASDTQEGQGDEHDPFGIKEFEEEGLPGALEEEPESGASFDPDPESRPEENKDDAESVETESSSRPFTLPKLSLSQHVKPSGGASKNQSRYKSEKMMWLIPIAALLIVALLLYFHFDGQRLGRTHLGDQAVVQDEIPVPIPEEENNEEQVIQEFVPSPDPVEEVAPPPDRDVRPEPVEDVAAEPADEVIRDLALPYGLMGPEEEVLIGAYTIVVHSLRNERKSEIEKQRLENQGYKATRWSAVLPSGITTYRVGIGQFKSVSDAERAVEQLPEPFRSNNFIIRIR
ncbi:MAG: SPOR domain-containing protein [Balneolaceae bacterium]|nr:MAG: SPOR domain-containing protein [Balneolaceae bacterium]